MFFNLSLLYFLRKAYEILTTTLNQAALSKRLQKPAWFSYCPWLPPRDEN